MGDQQSKPPAGRSPLLCAACGYDIAGVAAGSACPECGAPVFGFEAAEAHAHHLRGMAMVLWGLPATLLACLTGYVAYILAGTGEGRMGTVAAQRAGIALSIVPVMVTLVGLWIAVGPASGATLARWLRRVVMLMFVLVAVLGAQRLVAHLNASTPLGLVTLGGGNFTYAFSKLTPNWIRTYGLGAVAGAAPVLAALWSAWMIRASAAAGLMPRTRRVVPAAVAAAAAVLIAFALPEMIDWIARQTIPGLVNPGQPGFVPRGFPSQSQPPAPPIPWHAEWVNPDSALLVAVIGYVLVILLCAWLWVCTLRLRERTRLFGAAPPTDRSTSAS